MHHLQLVFLIREFRVGGLKAVINEDVNERKS